MSAICASCPAGSVDGVSLGGGWLDLKIETAGIDPAELCRYSVNTAKKKYYRMKNGEFLQLSGGGLQALDSLTADLGLTKSEFQAGRRRYLPTVLLSGQSLRRRQDETVSAG
ncbi:MAG: SNF2 helicase associated domain-containing protein [Clostridium fessum]